MLRNYVIIGCSAKIYATVNQGVCVWCKQFNMGGISAEVNPFDCTFKNVLILLLISGLERKLLINNWIFKCTNHSIIRAIFGLCQTDIFLLKKNKK